MTMKIVAFMRAHVIKERALKFKITKSLGNTEIIKKYGTIRRVI